jgi:hypothetical protein
MPLYTFQLCLYAGYTLYPMQWLLIDNSIRTEEYISKLGLPVSGSRLQFPSFPALRGAKCSTGSSSLSNAWERMSHYPQNNRVGGPQSWSGRFGEERTFGPADSISSCPYRVHYLALLFDVYCRCLCQMISNCHLGGNEHVRIDLCCFSICTDIRIDQ